MTTPPYNSILKRIRRWRLETVAYRVWNILFFLAAKILVPLASAVIATNLSVASTGQTFVSNHSMIILGIGIAVMSALDSFFNPGLQKYRAHRKNIELASLEEKLTIRWSSVVDESARTALLAEVSSDLKSLLSKYAAEAYGSNGNNAVTA